MRGWIRAGGSAVSIVFGNWDGIRTKEEREAKELRDAMDDWMRLPIAEPYISPHDEPYLSKEAVGRREAELKRDLDEAEHTLPDGRTVPGRELGD